VLRRPVSELHARLLLRSRFRGENAICMCNLRRRCARPKNYLTIITVACARGSARKQLGRRGRGHSPSQRTPGSQPFIHSQVSSKLSRSLKSPERLANVGKFRREEETVRRARSSAADKLVFSHIAAASERARTQPAPARRTDQRTRLLACPGKSIFQANYVPPIAQPSHRENMRAAGNPL
jgi:hypothetical protein